MSHLKAISPLASLGLGMRVATLLWGNKRHINLIRVSKGKKKFFFLLFRMGGDLNGIFGG